MRRGAALAVVLAAALASASCQRPKVTVIPTSRLPEDVYGSPSPGPLGEIPDAGTVYLVRGGRLLRVTRELPPASSLPAALLEALLVGRSGIIGVRTAIPQEARLLSVQVEGGVATVDLTSEFERGAAGRQLTLRVAQIVYTLTEDPRVRAVLFSIEGAPAGVVGQHDEVIERPVTRADYSRLAPRKHPRRP